MATVAIIQKGALLDMTTPLSRLILGGIIVESCSIGAFVKCWGRLILSGFSAFFDSINELNSSDYFSKKPMTIDSPPSFLCALS